MPGFKILEVEMDDGEPSRYAIVDLNNKLLDDADGNGYSSYNKASKAAWYKYQGGKDVMENIKDFWKRNTKLAEKLKDFEIQYFKEIHNGEILFEYEAKEIAAEMKIPDFSHKYLKYLHEKSDENKFSKKEESK